MAWFRVDDSLAFHAKTVAAGNAAMGLWVRAGAWCSQQGTDGQVPGHMLGPLGGRVRDAEALVSARLWLPDSGGYLFHDWLNYQPSAAEVREQQASKHEARVKAGRAGGIASGVARRKHSGSTDEADAKQNEAPSRPDPSPPTQLPLSSAEPPRQDVETLCSRLADLMEANGSKRPAVSQAWRDEARRLFDIDHRPLVEALRLVEWCQADTFWRSNIQSIPKFREKYDGLRLRAMQGQAPTHGVGYRSGEDTGPSRVLTADEWAAETS